MSLRRRLWLARSCVWGAALGALVAMAAALEVSVGYLVLPFAFVAWFVTAPVMRRVLRGAYVRAGRLIEAEDFANARRVVRELQDVYAGSRPALEHLRYYEASVLSGEGRWAEAAALLDSIDRKLLAEGWEPLVLNNLAWTLALSGSSARAVAVARDSLDAQDRAGTRVVLVPDLRACQLGTLGAALVVDGAAAEGVALLEQALARGGKPREQAARLFFLGEGMSALGKADEALRAYERAAKEAPSNEFGKRAAARLTKGLTYRT
jgi:tetratricopeptide (TPR) repeat protein